MMKSELKGEYNSELYRENCPMYVCKSSITEDTEEGS